MCCIAIGLTVFRVEAQEFEDEVDDQPPVIEVDPSGRLIAPQDGVPVEREFGIPRHWLNMTPDDRLPVRERHLQFGPLKAPIPPRPQRSGLTPRLAVTAEWQDNIFLTPEDPVSDTILTASPGFDWTKQGAGWSLFADYALESALFLKESDLSKAINGQSALLGGTYDLDQRTSFTMFDAFVDTRDAGEALIPEAVPPLSFIRTNLLVATVKHQLSSRAEIRPFYENQLQFSDTETAPKIVTHEAGAEIIYKLTPTDRVTGRYAASVFDFSAQDIRNHDGLIRYEREFGERFTANLGIGAIGTEAEGGRVFPQFEGTVSASIRDLLITVGADRDLLTAAGVGDPVLSTEVNIAVLARLTRGLQLEARLERQWLKVLDADQTTLNSMAAEGRLSYAIDDNLWIWAGYRGERETLEDSVTTSNRVLVGLVRTFPPERL